MVLAQETDYVLLDEPLNNLDIARSVEMMTMLERAAREFSRTIIIVLHDINFAARYASQICALKDGTVAFMGTPEEINARRGPHRHLRHPRHRRAGSQRPDCLLLLSVHARSATARLSPVTRRSHASSFTRPVAS